MGPIIPANFGDLLFPEYIISFRDEIKAEPSNIPLLYTEIKSSLESETFSAVGEFGDLENFTAKPQIAYQELQQLYKKKLAYIAYVTGTRVSRRMAEDDRHGLIKQVPNKLARAAFVTKQKHAASPWLEAFTAEASDGDGCELCASDHPYSPNSDNTWNNEGTSAASVTAVAATRILMAKFKNDIEEQDNTKGNMLIGGLNTEEIFYEIINAKGQVDSDQNNPNFHKGKYDHLVWDLLDDDDWFMVDKRKMKLALYYINHTPYELHMNKSDSFEALFVAYVAYIFGYIRPDWIFGHKVN